MVYRFLTFMMFLVSTLSWAHEAAPPVQLAGIAPCVQTSSVQLGLEDLPAEVKSQVDAEQVRRDVHDYLIATFQRLEIPYGHFCPESPSFLLVGIYARFLDPASYVGFPTSSYTYLTTGQLGTFSPQPMVNTALVPTLYSTSVSEIFQAPDARALSQEIVSLGQTQVNDFVRHWLEANTVPRTLYLLFAVLGTALVALRLLPRLIR